MVHACHPSSGLRRRLGLAGVQGAARFSLGRSWWGDRCPIPASRATRSPDRSFGPFRGMRPSVALTMSLARELTWCTQLLAPSLVSPRLAVSWRSAERFFWRDGVDGGAPCRARVGPEMTSAAMADTGRPKISIFWVCRTLGGRANKRIAREDQSWRGGVYAPKVDLDEPPKARGGLVDAMPAHPV